MIVMGIDPGIGTMGYGFVQEQADGETALIAFGAITTAADLRTEQRLQKIAEELRLLIAQYKPTTAAVERLLFGKNVTNAMNVGQARGVALLILADNALKIGEYTPAEIKQAVAGYGDAPKAQMQQMVRMLLNLEQVPRPDDAADALAVALTHLRYVRYQSITESP